MGTHTFRSTLPGLLAGLILLVFGASVAHAQTTVTASWDRNSDPYTAGYRVYYGTASGSYQWSFDAGNQVSAPVNLSPGSTYYFVVRAYNAQYEDGPPSTEASIRVQTPAPPTAQITATMQSNDTALVTWQTANATSATINGTSVALNGSTTVTVTGQTTYQIVATAADGRTATARATVSPAPPPSAQISATMQSATAAVVTWQTANATSATINGNAVALSGQMSVNVTTQTTFQLVARAADGRAANASASVTPPAPATPTATITASLQGSNTAVVTWRTANAVSATLNGQAVALSGTVSVPVTTTTVFTIRAVNAAGAAAQSSATVTVVTPTAPGSPRNLAASVSGSRVTLTWLAPSGTPATHYLVDVGTGPGRADLVSAYNVGNVLTVSTDFVRGTYYVRVRAANAMGASAPSNEARFSIGRRLRTPTGFQVNWEGSTAVLSWRASSGDTAEDAPASYVLEAGTSPGAANVARVNVGQTTQFSTAIPAGTYYVRVKAENALGQSEPSREIELRAPGAPEAPTALAATGAGPVVDLRWDAPAGGSSLSGYLIEAGSAPGLANLAQLQVGNVTRFTTTAPSGTYYLRVRAMNGRGPSGPSNEIVVSR